MAKLSRKAVVERAFARCEYCHLAASESILPHEIDHIRARKHRGPNTLQNTCLACAQRNGAKGSDATAFDPESDELVHLFNPRNDSWNEHFYWRGAILRGRTPVARATIELLRINDADRVEHRRLIIEREKH